MSGDDVWASDGEEHGGFEKEMANREWSRLHQIHSDAGYREGITEGKNYTLQQGFDRGFREGLEVGRKVGRLRGIINTLLKFHTQNPDILLPSCAVIPELQALEKELSSLGVEHFFTKDHFLPEKEDKNVSQCSGTCATQGCAKSTENGVPQVSIDALTSKVEKIARELGYSFD
ncbi:uncharacterized protein VTP21DRAFT_8790 [Calcarisporiella thermophila]|uniref:uncharacterized protein n=1 Tax=Calcarisporiella thermophila TaxID=911321 RepID=UPI003742D464